MVFTYIFAELLIEIGGKIAEALEYVQKAQAIPNLPSPLLTLLYRLEASIFECDGDFVSSLHRFEHALKLSPLHTLPSEKQFELMHVCQEESMFLISANNMNTDSPGFTT